MLGAARRVHCGTERRQRSSCDRQGFTSRLRLLFFYFLNSISIPVGTRLGRPATKTTQWRVVGTWHNPGGETREADRSNQGAGMGDARESSWCTRADCR